MPCRTCPPKIENAERIIEETRTYLPHLVPPGYDWDHIQEALKAIAASIRDELIRQGRWP